MPVVRAGEGSTKKSKAFMKRIGNLYGKIISIENLDLAERRARRHKERRREVIDFMSDRERLLYELHGILSEHRYRTSGYTTFIVHDPKERTISRLPYYPDRIVQQAIMNVLEPIWKPLMIADTYSSIKGRGIMGAWKKMQRIMSDREGSRYCLKIDIRKFYPSIDHDVLKAIVRKKIKCKDTLALLDELIDSADGLPMGNGPSQFLSNLMLTYFDHWIKEEKKVRHYVRYADDMVFFARDKESLHRLLTDIRAYLAGLKLKLKGNEQIFPVAQNRYDRHGRGVDFIGFVFFHGQTLIRKRIKKNFCRRAAALNRRRDMTPEEYRKALCSWFGWAKYSNSRHLMKKVLKPDLMKPDTVAKSV